MSMGPGHPNWEFQATNRDYRNDIEFRTLRETDPVEDHQITVFIRKRPLNMKEVGVISVPNKRQIVVQEPKFKVDLTKFLDILQI
jgi:hypothetical protein